MPQQRRQQQDPNQNSESVFNGYGTIRAIDIDSYAANRGGQWRVIALVGWQITLCIERRSFI
jgi:hypothetical protein